MFQKLRQKWKVSGPQLALIIITFAIGGSATGFVGKKIINALPIHQDWLWTLVYILLVTIIWPVAVVIISIFFGQYKFFSGYVLRLGMKIGIVKERPQAPVDQQLSQATIVNSPSPVVQLAIFASGAGSNAQKIIDHFRYSSLAKISLIVSNKPGAGVLKIAEKENISSIIIEKERFFHGDGYLPVLQQHKIDLIVLAGFLWKIPDLILKAYPKKIVNIHPALLPKFGGKGMYGQFVHEAVLTANEKESGITIHYVDEQYDNGDIILQVKCPVLEGDTTDSLAHRIHILEHANYPVVIEELVRKMVK
jgi:formyltetrahydrofolate-dependent phosphoribosylglycinamide formyltransferase